MGKWNASSLGNVTEITKAEPSSAKHWNESLIDVDRVEWVSLSRQSRTRDTKSLKPLKIGPYVDAAFGNQFAAFSSQQRVIMIAHCDTELHLNFAQLFPIWTYYTQHSIYLAILGTLTSQPSECLSVAHYPFLLRYHKAGTIVRLCVRALRMQHFPFRSVDGAFEWFWSHSLHHILSENPVAVSGIEHCDKRCPYPFLEVASTLFSAVCLPEYFAKICDKMQWYQK